MAELEPQGGDRAGSGLTDAEGNPTGHVLDHADRGVDFLLAQFKDKPRIEAFLRVLLAQVQDLEDALWDLYTLRTLDTAEGVQLDGLGDIVGEPRAARTDTVYRRFIRVRILVNLSNGLAEELYAIGLLALAGSPSPILKIWEHFPKAMTMELLTSIYAADVTAEQMMGLFRQAKDGGTKLRFVFATSAAASGFIWGDSSLGLVADTARGWGSYGSALLGGFWPSAVS